MLNKKVASFVAANGSESAASRAERRGSKYFKNDIMRTATGFEDGDRPSGVPKSLGEVLRSSQMRHKFRTFLWERHAAESLLFYESVELYQNIANEKWRKRAAEGLIAKFITTNAEYEINISSGVRNKLLRTMRWDRASFDDAKADVYELMKANFFGAFVAREFLQDKDVLPLPTKGAEAARGSPTRKTSMLPFV